MLRFKASEMDDVLKSLTVSQTGGQGVSAIRYDSSDPLSKRLEVFPFHIGESINLARILDQFKGNEVIINRAEGSSKGIIVSARTVPGGTGQSERQELLLISGDGELRTVDPASAAGIRFLDESNQGQFLEYLAVLARARGSEKKTVTIESRGGTTRVHASYVVPTPIWKSSYRLVLDDPEGSLLEGWAIVDNTSGEDWDGVTLSLVSGLPISFISRLYQPRYIARPVVELQQDRAARPMVHASAVEHLGANMQIAGVWGVVTDESGAAIPGADVTVEGMSRGLIRRAVTDSAGRYAIPGLSPGRYEVKAGSAGFSTFAQAINYRGGTQRVDVTLQVGSVTETIAVYGEAPMLQTQMSAAPGRSTIAATARQADLGELFEYRIDHPVTIKKGESAMLPFLRERIESRRLLVFDETSGSLHPLNAVEITNATEATLDGGAITVYDAGAYAGEALVETIKAGDKRLISYAVDLGTRISTAFDSDQELLSRFTIRHGVITFKSTLREVKTYTVHNVDAESKLLVIEHPVREGYRLLGLESSEKTANGYRFEVDLPSAKTTTFGITEETTISNFAQISNLGQGMLVAYLNNEELDDAGRGELGRIHAAQKAVTEVEGQIARLEDRMSLIDSDQDRLRKNIETLRNVPSQQQLIQRYAQQLGAQDSELLTLREQRASLIERRTELQRQARKLIEEIVY